MALLAAVTTLALAVHARVGRAQTSRASPRDIEACSLRAEDASFCYQALLSTPSLVRSRPDDAPRPPPASRAATSD